MYSLYKMSGSEISDNWNAIWGVIEQSGGVDFPRTEEAKINILGMLVADHMQCFMVLDEEKKITAAIVTMLMNDPCGVKNLYIYTLYAYEVNDLKCWKDVFEALKKWARKYGCRSITGHANNKRSIQLTKYLGGSVDTIYLQIPIGG